MALVVVNSHWMALSQHSLSLDGAFSKKRATWRQTTPSNDSRRHKMPTGANRRQAATTRDEKRQEVSRVRSFIPAVVSRRRSSRKWNVTGSRNFLRGKTDNKEWPERLAQANLRAHRAPCQSTRTSEATDSTSDLNTSGSPRPSGTR